MNASPSARVPPDWKRTAAWVAGATVVAWVACFRFPQVWLATGIGEAVTPFMDLYGLLAASDAARAGVDPFLPNNFDPYHRPHVYSEWWLALGRLGLTRADTAWLGVALLLAVLGTAVVMVRPRTGRQGLGLFLLLVSPAMLMAANRANNDLVVFLVVSLGLLCFRRWSGAGRALGVALFAVAAVLKYYPVVTLVALLESRSRRGFLAQLGLYALILLLAWPGLVSGLQSAARYMPQPEWLYAFGAPVFLRNLGRMGSLLWLVPAGLMAVWAAGLAWRKLIEPGKRDPAPESAAEREFILGAAMLVGLFFLGSSYVYKLVFALWLLPWLWSEQPDPREARWARTAWWLLLAVAWLEGAAATGINLAFGPRSPELALGLLQGALALAQLLTWLWVACLVRLSLVLLGPRLRAWWPAGRP